MAFLKRVRMARVLRYLAFAIAATAVAQHGDSNLYAQTATQQRVYGSASVTTSTSVLPGYAKDSTTGALTSLGGTPFADKLEGGLVAIDGQGKFLFVLNAVSNSISMYQIDGSNGALSEVPSSPFAAGPTVNPNMAPSHPISLATEISGKFLYVGYANGDSSTTSALIPFSIDATNLKIVLTPQLSLDFGNGVPVQMLTDPKGLRLYVGMGPGGNQAAIAAGTTVYSIGDSNGVLTAVGNAGGGTDWGRAIAIDPQGRFFFDGWGQSQGFVDSGAISPVDGTSSANSTVDLGQGVFPLVLFVESSGKFLYVQTNAGLSVYSIDQTSGVLTLLNGPLVAFAFTSGTVAADPMGPYVYSLERTGVDVFQIDPQTGNLAEIPGAPFALGTAGAQGSLGLAVSGSPTLNASGPVAQLFPTSEDLGQTTVGKSSATKIVALVNTGDQLLAVNGISITGVNASDFAQSNTCVPTLAPNANCSISVFFNPSAAGLEEAMLQITDDGAASPQSTVLTGTGLATASSVTLMPGNLDFGTVAEGANIAAKTVQITNSGTSALHISAVALSGSNPGDFSQNNTCVAGPVAVQGSCSITVNFVAQSEGQRSAAIVVTDDAANSPQSVALTGDLASPFQLAAVPAGATIATVSAGRTANYPLQLMPGPGYTGSVAMSCSGAPLGAACSVAPGTMTISNGNAVPFQVMVTTSGSALVFPPSSSMPKILNWNARVVWVIVLLMMGWFVAATVRRERRLARQLVYVAVLIGTFTTTIAGCGGSQAPDPVKIVTPQGTTILTVTAKSGSLTPQSIQLTLTVQ